MNEKMGGKNSDSHNHDDRLTESEDCNDTAVTCTAHLSNYDASTKVSRVVNTNCDTELDVNTAMQSYLQTQLTNSTNSQERIQSIHDTHLPTTNLSTSCSSTSSSSIHSSTTVINFQQNPLSSNGSAVSESQNNHQRLKETENQIILTSMQPAPKFLVKQRIYARDEISGSLYKAIIRKTIYGPVQKHLRVSTFQLENDQDETENESMSYDQKEDDYTWHYFVHYLGWNVKWDRWVEQSSIFEDTDNTGRLAKLLEQEIKQIRKISKGFLTTTKKNKVTTIQTRMKQMVEDWRHGIEITQSKYNQAVSKEVHALEKEEETIKQNMNNSDVMNKKTEKKGKGPTKNQIERELHLYSRDLREKRPRVVAEKINLPFTLKKALTDEWEVISQCNMVHNLPASVTAHDVLQKYLRLKRNILLPNKSHKDKSSSVNNQNHSIDGQLHEKLDDKIVGEQKDEESKIREWVDMVDGISKFFEESLPFKLLYKQEISQFHVIEKSKSHEFMIDEVACVEEMKRKRKRSEIYGCEYLLRLIVLIPELMLESNITEEKSSKILYKIGDLVRFINKHQDVFFTQSYRHPSQEEEHLDKTKKKLTVLVKDFTALESTEKHCDTSPHKKRNEIKEHTKPVKSLTIGKKNCNRKNPSEIVVSEKKEILENELNNKNKDCRKKEHFFYKNTKMEGEKIARKVSKLVLKGQLCNFRTGSKVIDEESIKLDTSSKTPLLNNTISKKEICCNSNKQIIASKRKSIKNEEIDTDTNLEAMIRVAKQPKTS